MSMTIPHAVPRRARLATELALQYNTNHLPSSSPFIYPPVSSFSSSIFLLQCNRTVPSHWARPGWSARCRPLLQTGRILLPQTREAHALAAELLDYEIRVNPDANERYGAFKVGTHNDLVTALGLAV